MIEVRARMKFKVWKSAILLQTFKNTVHWILIFYPQINSILLFSFSSSSYDRSRFLRKNDLSVFFGIFWVVIRNPERNRFFCGIYFHYFKIKIVRMGWNDWGQSTNEVLKSEKVQYFFRPSKSSALDSNVLPTSLVNIAV